MSRKLAPFVAVGMAAGIVLIVITAIIFSSSNKPSDSGNAKQRIVLAIEGLKDSYHIREPISFTLRVSGFGYYCQTPNAAIWNASSAFASIPVWTTGLPEQLCDNASERQMLNDTYSWDKDRSAVIEEPGNYIMGARIGRDAPVQAEFRIVP